MTSNKGHILVVDDDHRLRHLLRRYLTEHGYAVTEATNATEARELLTLFIYDLMILDVMMPGETGLELARNLPTRRIGALPILMLTAMGSADDRIKGLEAGVDDYLPKPFEPRELLLRIESVLRRVAATKPKSDIRFGAFVFDRERRQLMRDEEIVTLTGNEAMLLARLCEQPGVPVSRDLLGELLGGAENLRNVDVQIGRLRKKVESDTTKPQFIQTVRGAGYKLVI